MQIDFLEKRTTSDESHRLSAYLERWPAMISTIQSINQSYF